MERGDGILQYIDMTDDCCICLENKTKGIKMPKCNYIICLEDLKKLYRNADPIDGDHDQEVIPLSCPLCRAN